MFELKNEIEAWISGGHEIALATVVRTWGSSPRAAGAKMAIRGDGAFVGSVSGGCVEGAVIETGLDVLKTAVPQLLHFGVTDESAWEVGLACGGEIDVFVQRIENASYAETIDALRSESSIAIITIITWSIFCRGLIITVITIFTTSTTATTTTTTTFAIVIVSCRLLGKLRSPRVF